MNFVVPTKYINIDEYEYIVSIGNKCPTTMILRKLGIYNEAFPFDYIPTTPGLILKYLQNQDDFYPLKGKVRTMDGVWFGHYNIDDKYTDTIDTFKRRFVRLFDMLKNKKKILFVYTSEADVYNEMNNRYNDNYDSLLKIVTYLKDTYKYNNFKLLCIHTNKTFDDTDNIVNYTINVPIEYCSDDMSTHINSVYSIYRNVLTNFFKQIFK